MTNFRKKFMGKQLMLIFALLLMVTGLAGCGADAGAAAKTDAELVEEGWVKNPAENGWVLESEVEEGTEAGAELAELPAPLIDENAEAPYASTNSSINVSNLDEYLNRDDVFYVDIRDYVDYSKKHFRNFEVIPYFGYIFNAEANTNPEMIQLYGGTPDAPVDVYAESDSTLNAMFPKDKTLFIMCEKGGRVTQLMQILDAKGYDMSKVYNIGGVGEYTDKKYSDHLTDTYELELEETYNLEGMTRN